MARRKIAQKELQQETLILPESKQEKPKKPKKKKNTTDKAYTYTKTGHRLTQREARFVDKYLELGNGREAVLQAGYKTKAPEQYANNLLRKIYIAEEIHARAQEISKSTIASAEEVMNYFSAVMRGEIKDQFGLEAPLSERTKAAQELARRTVDIENRLAGKADAEIKISLDWNRGEE